MTVGHGMDWGSVADWVSGIGSISAAVIALWLSGSERRARRQAERPVVTCRLTRRSDGWLNLMVNFDNPAAKPWICTSARVVSPKAGRVVHEKDTVTAVRPWAPEFSDEQREANAAPVIPLRVEIGANGTTVPTPWGKEDGHRSWFRLQVQVGEALSLRLRLSFESLDPAPERYNTMIHRPVP